MNDQGRTQRTTAADIAHRRIRIPIGEKDLFPSDRTRVSVRLKGVDLDEVAWDPRLGPHRERSGVLYIGPRLAGLVLADERLIVTNADGILDIGGRT